MCLYSLPACVLVCVSVKQEFNIPSSCLGSGAGSGKTTELHPAWVGRSIAGPRLRMVEFSAFLEQQLHPDSDAVMHPCISTFCFSVIDTVGHIQEKHVVANANITPEPLPGG